VNLFLQDVKIVPVFENSIQRDNQFKIYTDFLEQKKVLIESRIVEIAKESGISEKNLNI